MNIIPISNNSVKPEEVYYRYALNLIRENKADNTINQLDIMPWSDVNPVIRNLFERIAASANICISQFISAKKLQKRVFDPPKVLVFSPAVLFTDLPRREYSNVYHINVRQKFHKTKSQIEKHPYMPTVGEILFNIPISKEIVTIDDVVTTLDEKDAA